MNKSGLIRLCTNLCVLVVISTAALRPCVTYACSCAPFQEPEQAKDGAAAVFAGRVVATEPIKSRIQLDRRFPFVHFERDIFGQRQVTFAVAEVWKGQVGKQVSVATGGMCGAYPFVRDGAYIVYANPQRGSGISATMCNRVKSFDSLEDRTALGVGTKVDGFQMKASTASAALPVIMGIGSLLAFLVVAGVLHRRRSV